jgi:dihydrofolate reductase
VARSYRAQPDLKIHEVQRVTRIELARSAGKSFDAPGNTGGTDIVVAGGGALASEIAGAGLLAQMFIGVVPVMLASGTPLLLAAD